MVEAGLIINRILLIGKVKESIIRNFCFGVPVNRTDLQMNHRQLYRSPKPVDTRPTVGTI